LFNPHVLDALFSDPSGMFASSSASAVLPAIFFDFFNSFIAAELQGLTQFQLL
jgi:hypothetical protein